MTDNSNIPTYHYEYGKYKSMPDVIYIDIKVPGFRLENPEHRAAIDEVLPVLTRAIHKAMTGKEKSKVYEMGDEG